jgi:hypothetical protein
MAGRQLLRPATGSRQHTASLCSPLNRYLSFYIGNRLRERERHAIPLVCRCRSIGSSLLLDRRDAGYSHRHPSFGEETIDGWIPVSLPFINIGTQVIKVLTDRILLSNSRLEP